MYNRNALILDVFGVFLGLFILQYGILKESGQKTLFIKFWYAHQQSPPDWLIYYTVAGISAMFLIMVFNPIKGKKGAYGYAAWATKTDVKNMRDNLNWRFKNWFENLPKLFDKGLFSEQGIILGKAWNRYLRMNKPLSMILFSPPGTGKTAGFAIPSLLSCGNSMFIFDVKGELYRKTSLRRSTFSRIIRFAPAEPGSAKWNPLAKEVLPAEWPAQMVEVDRIAELIYETAGKDDYWVTEGKAMFIFFSLYLVWKNGETSLPEVRSYALSSPEPQELIESMMSDGGESVPSRVQEEGNALLAKAEKEFASVFSTFKSKLNVFSDPYVTEAMSGNDFIFSDFRESCHSFYLCVSAQDVKRLAPLVRLLFESCAMYILSNEPKANDLIITLMVDEFPRLGQMNAVLDMPALARGNRGQAILIAQSFAQIEELYGRTGVDKIKDTCSYFIIYPQNNYNTAENISKTIGNTTRMRESRNVGGKDPFGSRSESYEGVALVTPQDLLSMESWSSIVLVQNYFARPIKANAIQYWNEKSMEKLEGEYIAS